MTSEQLRDQLIETLKLIKNKNIIILLDSIDQLVNTDYELEKWMIFDGLPSNVKIILSTLENYEGILDKIQSKISNKENFLKIDELNPTNVKTILEDWLNKAQRSLSQNQWMILDNVFKNATLHPLFVKLIYDIIIKWQSFYEPSVEFQNIQSIDICIKYLFRQLEKEHGAILFSTCVFYMNIMENGISENELEDILSLDDDLLTQIFEFHSPPLRRFPIALWFRIKHVMKEYLVEKEIDDTKVIFW